MVSLSNHVAISLTKLTPFAVVILAVYAIWLLADPGQTHACSCADSGSPAEALARADAVFAGEVVSVRVGRSSLLYLFVRRPGQCEVQCQPGMERTEIRYHHYQDRAQRSIVRVRI